jgi:aspartate aminotransferase-like enzyme
VRREVLEAMLRPMIPHRGKEFEQLFGRLQRGLQDVFRTTRPILVSSSSATGLMEASVRCAPPGRLLSIVNGSFSERFANIARACGRDTDVLEVPLGGVSDPDEVAARLESRGYAAVTVVHSETSTGALSDVRRIGDLARERGARCLVDSVTGVGATPLHFDDWDMDFVLTGSQKALALPPGLALGVASERYMRTAGEAPDRGLYFDLVEFESYALRGQTPNTPALPLLYALDAQLEAIAAEGVEARWARHRAMARRTHSWVAERAGRYGISVLAREGARSDTVTAVVLPDGVASGEVVRAVARRGITIGGGYGTMRERTFRIGHMGDHTLATLEHCLDACDAALEDVLAAR